MKRTLLIDADIVAFKFASVTETVVYFDGRDAEPAVDADFDKACEQAGEYIAELIDRLNATEAIICLSDPEVNFRKTVWAGYKAQRVNARKPTDLMTLKAWFATKYKTYQRPALEADDCMGILSTHPTLVKGEKIIVSEDKDMKTIPGWLFNPAKDAEPQKIGRLAADRFHLWQTITGDATDGYPGARGVGEKSDEACAVLTSKTVEEMWGHVLAAYKRSRAKPEDLPPAEQAVVMARLARILRASDWEFNEKRPRLWNPPLVG